MLTPFHFGIFVALGFFFALTLGRKGPWGKFFGWLLLLVLGAASLHRVDPAPSLTANVVAQVWSYSLALLPLWWLVRWTFARRAS